MPDFSDVPHQYPVSMDILTLSSAPKVPFNLNGHILFTSPAYELVHLQLEPGESIPLHSNPFDVVFFVLEGRLVLTCGEESGILEADSCVSVPSGILRGLSNPGNQAAKVLVNKLLHP